MWKSGSPITALLGSRHGHTPEDCPEAQARAAVLGGPPDIDAEELAAEIYKVMAAKAPKQRTAIPRRTCAPRATVVSHTHERADCRPWWRLDTSPSPRVKRRSYAPHPS